MSAIDYYAAPDFAGFFIGISFLIFMLAACSYYFSKSKTQRYREGLVDLYVSAKVRKLAAEDGLDLDKEKALFLHNVKESKRYLMNLNQTIEEDLKDKLDKSQKKEAK